MPSSELEDQVTLTFSIAATTASEEAIASPTMARIVSSSSLCSPLRVRALCFCLSIQPDSCRCQCIESLVATVRALKYLYFIGPYATTVGGATGVNPEVTANFSGGDFSNYISQPSYQSAAVSTFLTDLGDQFQGLYK